MNKNSYIAPKIIEQLKMQISGQNLLATFSLSGNVDDYEGEELEDF